MCLDKYGSKYIVTLKLIYLFYIPQIITVEHCIFIEAVFLICLIDKFILLSEE